MTGPPLWREAVHRTAKAGFAVSDLFLGGWPGPRLLIYHDVTDQPALQMEIGPEMFTRQVEWMVGHGSVVPLEDALADPDGHDASSRFVLTFDDGYRGLYEHAFPVMRERDVPFTLYVTSGIVDSAAGASDGDGLGWDEVNEMMASGLMTMGAHTHTHPDLRELSTDQVDEEVSTSDDLIARHTGVRPRHFAYPKGYWSATAEPVIARTYATAVLGAGPPITSATNPHRLCRVAVQRSDGFVFFKRKMQTGMRVEEWTRSRLKGYSNPTPSGETRG